MTQTLAANPQLARSRPPATASAAATGVSPSAFGSDRGTPPRPEPKPETKPAAKAASNDPVDPDGFKRTFHPGRKAEAPPK